MWWFFICLHSCASICLWKPKLQKNIEIIFKKSLDMFFSGFIFSSGPDRISTRTDWQTLRRAFRFLSLCLLSVSVSLCGEFFLPSVFYFCWNSAANFRVLGVPWDDIVVWSAGVNDFFCCEAPAPFVSAPLWSQFAKLCPWSHCSSFTKKEKFALRSCCQPLIFYLLCSPVVGDSVVEGEVYRLSIQ